MVPLAERHRARSESPGRMDEPKQPSSQVCSGFRIAALVEESATVCEQNLMNKKDIGKVTAALLN